jgi:hypothetical protein
MRNQNKMSSVRALENYPQAIPKKVSLPKPVSQSITAKPGGQFIPPNL